MKKFHIIRIIKIKNLILSRLLPKKVKIIVFNFNNSFDLRIISKLIPPHIHCWSFPSDLLPFPLPFFRFNLHCLLDICDLFLTIVESTWSGPFPVLRH